MRPDPFAHPLLVTRAPHIHSGTSIPSRMWMTVLALSPVVLASAFFFGTKSLWIIFHAVTAACLSEMLAEKIFNRPIRIWDGSAFLIGLILAINLPVSVPWWMAWAGSFIAVFVGRELSGGLATNRFHPVLLGLAVLLAVFPVALTHYREPFLAGNATSCVSLILGNIPGALGETSKIAILLGGLFLIYKRLIFWQNPASFLGAVFLAGLVLGKDPFYEVLSGASFLAAFFLTTDSVTSPLTLRGQMIFAACAGALSEILKVFIGSPEGIVFGILAMNALTPWIDRRTQNEKCVIF